MLFLETWSSFYLLESNASVHSAFGSVAFLLDRIAFLRVLDLFIYFPVLIEEVWSFCTERFSFVQRCHGGYTDHAN